MDWIFENLNIVIIIGVVIASIFKSRLDTKTEEADSPEEIPGKKPAVPLDQDKSYRKISPPVPMGSANPRSAPTPLDYGRPEAIPGAAAAAAEETAKILKHQQDLAAHLQQLRETKATTSGGAAATRARVASSKTKSPAKFSASTPISLRARLKNPAEVRRAFVLKEILDRPVGLR